jgi:hypothetical protein
LHTHTSRDFALYKEGTLLRQIERRMAMAGLATPVFISISSGMSLMKPIASRRMC